MAKRAHERLLKTEDGKAWFKEHGNIWTIGYDGMKWTKKHMSDFLKTETGKAWFKEHGNAYLERNHFVHSLELSGALK